MKRVLRILSVVVLLIIILSLEGFALITSEYPQEIKIDGNFDDWEDKPYVIDYSNDIKSNWLNFKEVRYFADDQYLYLYVERESANNWYYWNFKVLILNPEEGKKRYGIVPTQYRYYKKSDYYRPTKFKRMKYAEFKVSVLYSNYRGKKRIPVCVSLGNEKIETTLSASNNKKIVELRLPLNRVGLDMENKEVKFMLKSAYDLKAKKKGEYPYDWVPNGKPIILTTVSTYWKSSAIIIFSAMSYILYRIYKKKKKQDISTIKS